MSRQGLVTLVVVGLIVATLVATALVAAPVLAQEEGGAGEEEEEGGLEGAIEEFVEGQGLFGAVVVLAIGTVLLIVSAEKLISYLTRMALRSKISLFALAIVFTGFEFDDTILGLALAAGGLEGAALGTALGTGLAIIGVTLALAAIIQPFPVDLPNDYIALFALSPFLLVPFVLLGTLTLGPGLVLLGFFVLTFAYFIVRERQREIPVFRNTELGEAVRPDSATATQADGGAKTQSDGGTVFPEPLATIPEDRLIGDRSGWIWFGLSIGALAVLVFAAMLLEAGSEVAIEGLGVEGTVFGATVLTLILTFEDILLTIEPVRRGVPEIGVGNVIGSVLFSMTGNVGVLTLVATVTIAPSVLSFHLPAIILVTALAAYFMYGGELKRWHGFLLFGLYVAYWIIALTVFGGVPIGD